MKESPDSERRFGFHDRCSIAGSPEAFRIASGLCLNATVLSFAPRHPLRAHAVAIVMFADDPWGAHRHEFTRKRLAFLRDTLRTFSRFIRDDDIPDSVMAVE